MFLDEALLKRLKQAARREGRSFAAVVREAMAMYLTGAGRAPVSALPNVAGQFASGLADTAERADELLWKDPHA